jgi:small subunit ribosomal protein S27e
MTSKFVKIKCEKCKNEQMVFEKVSVPVKCLVCGEMLAEPTGGKSRINVKVLTGPEKEKEKQETEESQEEEA